MWKLNLFLSGDDEEREESFLEEESDGFCSLSPTQRMYAFAASLVAGLALMFLVCPPFGFEVYLFVCCWIVLKHKKCSLCDFEVAKKWESLIVFAKPIKFALLFTFGNVLAVGRLFGTPSWTIPAYSVVCYCVFGTFLIGPGRQLGMMFDPAQIYATAIYIGCVVLALICALLIHSKILTVFAIIFEICALIWQHLYNSFSEFNNRKFFWHFKCFVRYTYLPSLSYFSDADKGFKS
ncbi:hypothetical protein NC653_028793 [Populus alba x Populus x berolinensis]|uniref:Vesicle transport protein n=1 Tax=Populus alba x Populus x berolinensis TaxID=444605 RepID=A0AAD6Q2G0_9ROSI|nr:hypothetical protein NC653_028793 [Populus alba x Populus x berolinensis]